MRRLIRSLGGYVASFYAKEPSIFFGGMTVPDRQGEGGFMILGRSGAGKTTVLDILIRQVAPPLAWEGRDDRVLLYDSKQEYISKLQQLGFYDPVSAEMTEKDFQEKYEKYREKLEGKRSQRIPTLDELRSGFDKRKNHKACVIITNPFDERAYAWDLAEDFDRLRDGQQFVEIFTKATGALKSNDAEFFEKTAKGLFDAVFKALHRKKARAWTLRDFVLTCQNLDDMKSMLSSYDDTRAQWEGSLGEAIFRTDTGPSVYATLQAYLGGLAYAAGALHSLSKEHPTRKFSLLDWANSNSILLLGSSVQDQVHFELINRLMFHKASIELLRHPVQDDPRRNTWLILDELPELGYLTQLPLLLRKGRSWGVRVVFGFQEYSDLENAFTPNRADTVTTLAHTFGALNCSDKTAAWVHSKYGQYVDGEGNEKPRVRKGEVFDLPANPRAEGIVGWYYSALLKNRRAQRHPLDAGDVREVILKRRSFWDTEFERTDEESFILKKWEADERAAFGLPEEKPPPVEVVEDQAGGVKPGELPPPAEWPSYRGNKSVERPLEKAHNPGMGDGDELKDRTVLWMGKTVEFSCTDDELPVLSKSENFLRLMWESRQQARPGGLKLVSTRSAEELGRLRDEKAAARKPRRVEWDGKVIEFNAPDEEFDEHCGDEDYLMDKLAKQEGWRLYQESLRKPAGEGEGDKPPDQS